MNSINMLTGNSDDTECFDIKDFMKCKADI